MDQDKWMKLGLAQQLANIGSEAHRTAKWQADGNQNNQRQSAERVLELIDLTLAGSKKKGRLRELFRLREVFCDTFLNPQPVYGILAEKIEDYLLDFALLVRR